MPESEREGARHVRSRRLLSAALVGIGGGALAAIFGWIRSKGLALSLGPVGLGIYGQIWALVVYVGGLASLGIGVGTTALVARSRERGDGIGVITVARQSVVIPAWGGAAAALMAVAGASFIAPLVLNRSVPWLIVIAAASIPFVAVQLPLQHILQGFEDVVAQNVIYVLYSAVFAIAAIVGAYAGGIYGAVVGLLVGNVALVLLYGSRSRTLLRHEPRADASSRRPPSLRGHLLRVGVSSLAITLAWGAADLVVRTVLLRTHGAQVAGYWFALTILSVQFLGALAGALSYVVAPLAARTARDATTGGIRSLLDDSLRLTLIVIAPALIWLVATRLTAMRLLFSGGFEPAGRAIPAQAFGDLARTVSWALGVALVPLGLTRAWLLIGLATSIAFVGFGSWFGDRWSLSGVTVAWLVTWLISAAATAFVLHRSGALRVSRRVACGIAVSLGSLAVLSVTSGAAAIAVAIGASVLVVFVLSQRAERASVVRALRRRLGIQLLSG